MYSSHKINPNDHAIFTANGIDLSSQGTTYEFAGKEAYEKRRRTISLIILAIAVILMIMFFSNFPAVISGLTPVVTAISKVGEDAKATVNSVDVFSALIK